MLKTVRKKAKPGRAPSAAAAAVSVAAAAAPATATAKEAGSGSGGHDGGAPAAAADTLDLDRYAGKVVILDFWASWCVPCRRSFPWLNKMHDRYGDEGLVIVGVNLGVLPTKGLTLPFISYGGNSLIVFCALVGLVLRCALEEELHD